MHQADEVLVSGSGNLAKYFGLKMPPFSVDNRLIEGDLNICGFNLSVIETPGHTAGSVCVQIDNAIFTGDTLFLDSYGRTDFPSGSEQELIVSVKKLFALQGDFLLYSGHGESTTLERERKHNMINYLF
jgi:glyoxylase-like metal-dependent hydrolase (beta-lactamase superfamily II)